MRELRPPDETHFGPAVNEDEQRASRRPGFEEDGAVPGRLNELLMQGNVGHGVSSLALGVGDDDVVCKKTL